MESLDEEGPMCFVSALWGRTRRRESISDDGLMVGSIRLLSDLVLSLGCRSYWAAVGVREPRQSTS